MLLLDAIVFTLLFSSSVIINKQKYLTQIKNDINFEEQWKCVPFNTKRAKIQEIHKKLGFHLTTLKVILQSHIGYWQLKQ